MVRICRRWTPGEDELIRVAAGANKAPRGYTADDFRAGDRHLPKVVDPGREGRRIRGPPPRRGGADRPDLPRCSAARASDRRAVEGEEAMTALGPQGRRAAARIVELERENAELRAALAVAQRGAERAVEDGRRQERAQQARTMSGRVPSILTTLGGDR